jgi:hypothetical protein
MSGFASIALAASMANRSRAAAQSAQDPQKPLEVSDRAVWDIVCAVIWRRITVAVEQLENTTPPGPAH